MQKNGLIKQIKLISKFMTSQPGKQATAIFFNNARIKEYQAVKLD